jgi:hypothetical protein
MRVRNAKCFPSSHVGIIAFPALQPACSAQLRIIHNDRSVSGGPMRSLTRNQCQQTLASCVMTLTVLTHPAAGSHSAPATHSTGRARLIRRPPLRVRVRGRSEARGRHPSPRHPEFRRLACGPSLQGRVYRKAACSRAECNG